MNTLKYVTDKSDFTQVFSACLGKMMSRQNRLFEILGQSNWDIDFNDGKISFSNGLSYEFEFIGSESEISQTWLWGYENINGFEDRLLNLAKDSLNLGLKLNLAQLHSAEISLDDSINGHSLSVVACGLSERNLAYYACRYEGGCAFVALKGLDLQVFSQNLASEFLEICMRCLQNFSLDHQIFIKSFLDFNETKFELKDNTITAKFEADDKILEVKFDKLGRIEKLNLN